jgi:hypothetical protein
LTIAVEAFQRHGFQVQPNVRHHEHRAYSQRGESNDDRVIVAGQIEYQAENRGAWREVRRERRRSGACHDRVQPAGVSSDQHGMIALTG